PPAEGSGRPALVGLEVVEQGPPLADVLVDAAGHGGEDLGVDAAASLGHRGGGRLAGRLGLGRIDAIAVPRRVERDHPHPEVAHELDRQLRDVAVALVLEPAVADAHGGVGAVDRRQPVHAGHHLVADPQVHAPSAHPVGLGLADDVHGGPLDGARCGCSGGSRSCVGRPVLRWPTAAGAARARWRRALDQWPTACFRLATARPRTRAMAAILVARPVEAPNERLCANDAPPMHAAAAKRAAARSRSSEGTITGALASTATAAAADSVTTRWWSTSAFSEVGSTSRTARPKANQWARARPTVVPHTMARTSTSESCPPVTVRAPRSVIEV